MTDQTDKDVERVAMAMWDVSDKNSTWENAGENIKDIYRRRSSAAIAAMPQRDVTVQEAARKLSPDQIIEALSIRLGEADPDVEPWVLQWCDRVAAALNEPTSTKEISAELRALAGDKT